MRKEIESLIYQGNDEIFIQKSIELERRVYQAFLEDHSLYDMLNYFYQKQKEEFTKMITND